MIVLAAPGPDPFVEPAHRTLSQLPAWMPIGEARARMVAAGVHAVPVTGHEGLIGLITVEALGGEGADPPPPGAPILSVMDWHLVQVPPQADMADTVHAYSHAAWSWLRSRRLDARPREGVSRPVGPHHPGVPT